jgi:hypothetical protein
MNLCRADQRGWRGLVLRSAWRRDASRPVCRVRSDRGLSKTAFCADALCPQRPRRISCKPASSSEVLHPSPHRSRVAVKDAHRPKQEQVRVRLQLRMLGEVQAHRAFESSPASRYSRARSLHHSKCSSRPEEDCRRQREDFLAGGTCARFISRSPRMVSTRRRRLIPKVIATDRRGPSPAFRWM